MTRRLKDIRADMFALMGTTSGVALMETLITEYHAAVHEEAIYEALDELQREVNMADNLPEAGRVALLWAQTIVRGLIHDSE